MAIKITKTEYDALPDSVKGTFAAEGDDSYVQKTEDVGGLKSALEAERKLREAAERDARQTKQEFDGLNAEEIRKMLAEQNKAKEEADKKAGNFEAILKAKEEEWRKQYNAEKLRADTLEKDYTEKEIESVLVNSLSGAKVIPERLEAAKDLLRQKVVGERNDGKTVLKFKDATGYAQEMKPEDLTAKFKEANPYFFSADGKTGSDDRNGGGSFNGKTVLASDAKAIAENFDAIGDGTVTVVNG